MKKVTIYSFLLLIGMVFSQVFDYSSYHHQLEFMTLSCLAYIMFEVGLEFIIDKSNPKQYLKDYLVAFTAAAFPWIFCTLYFFYRLGVDLQESLLIARFASPTSAGILFAMLEAAGLGATWLFRKARILAIFDDVDTIILMIPLQIMIIGFIPQVAWVIFFIIFLFFVAYKYLNKLPIPYKNGWPVLWGIGIVLITKILEYNLDIVIEVLLPAFVLGCVTYTSPTETHDHRKFWGYLDHSIKYLFMFLVGTSLPKINLGEIEIGNVIVHVLIITILSNLGKMYPFLCYKKEASVRERLALSIAMFPRGEVGAGVLLVAINYDLSEKAITIGALSLVLNLLLTGLFIACVIWLIKPTREPESPIFLNAKARRCKDAKKS